MISLHPSVRLSGAPDAPEEISGRTSSRIESTGQRWRWQLQVADCQLAVWETHWQSGERELVLAKEVVEAAATPVSLSNLMARRRALIESARTVEYMSARRVDPDEKNWPRFSNCTEDDLASLVPAAAESKLRELGYQGSASRYELLNASDRNRNQLLAVFAPGAREAQIGFYVLTRVIPTLRHARVI